MGELIVLEKAVSSIRGSWGPVATTLPSAPPNPHPPLSHQACRHQPGPRGTAPSLNFSPISAARREP